MSETTAPRAASAAPSTGHARGRGRRAEISLHALQIALALFYGIASALPKLIAHPSAAESFDRLGWGSTGMYIIGALELAGAVALVIPVLSSVAAVALSALMVGAFIVQLTVFDGQYAATPLILLVPLILIAWTRRHRAADLLRLVRREA
ncbi:DoxX family protein [Streptomyces chiangmaiensis]|uniref:DoxX family protein n=1 Tax=Streptomyces chiangmaiensis TaxID=766497 RepID=A0ABU7FX03_9ACTN|nr:DoxX family protein [Streptomyces chiangmaiensis]MED7827619.1 DoxX family protein [Streptomyces chiangmaiensis]